MFQCLMFLITSKIFNKINKYKCSPGKLKLEGEKEEGGREREGGREGGTGLTIFD